MVSKGLTSGKYKLFSACVGALDYIINASELLGGYLPSFYELNKTPKEIRVRFNTNKKEITLNVRKNDSMRVLIKRICKVMKVEYGQVNVYDSNYKDLTNPDNFHSVEELLREQRLSGIKVNIKYQIYKDGQLKPDIKSFLEVIFDTESNNGKMELKDFRRVLLDPDPDLELRIQNALVDIFNSAKKAKTNYIERDEFINIFQKFLLKDSIIVYNILLYHSHYIKSIEIPKVF